MVFKYSIFVNGRFLAIWLTSVSSSNNRLLLLRRFPDESNKRPNVIFVFDTKQIFFLYLGLSSLILFIKLLFTCILLFLRLIISLSVMR